MTSFRFVAPEYHYRHKTADWYWAVGIITVSAAATAIIFNNILFAVLIVLAGFSLAMYASRAPKERDIEISDAGVKVGEYRFSYSNLQSFWLEHNEMPRLLLKTNRLVIPHVIIPVDTLNEDEKEDVRNFLKTKIVEEEQHEPFFEQVMEFIGF